MMKKKNLFILSTAALLLLASCGGNSQDSEATGLSSASSSATGISTEVSHDTGVSSEESRDTGLSSEESQDTGLSTEESSSSTEESSSSSEESSSSSEVVKHAISVEAPDFLEVTVEEEAEVGSTVVVTAKDKVADTYDVLRIKVNDGYASKNEDGTWSFVMPDEDVVVIPEYAEVLAHAVTLSDMVDTDIVELTGLDSFKRNTEVTLTVNLKNAGYEVSAVRMVGSETNLYDAATGKVTFLMPDEDVTLIVDYSGKMFALGLQDGTLPMTITADRLPLEDGKAEYGAAINVSLDSTADYYKVHRPVALVEVDSDPEVRYEIVNNAVNFLMPARDVLLALVSEDITYDIAVNGTEHIDLTLANKDPETGELSPKAESKGVYGEEIYVFPSISDTDAYGLASLKVTYQTDDYYNPTKTIDLLDGSHKDGEAYHFAFPAAKEGTELVITAEEANIKYAGEAFLGSYLGVNIVSDNYGGSSFSPLYCFDIDASGAIKDRDSEVRGTITDVDATSDTTYVTFAAADETTNVAAFLPGIFIAPAGFYGGKLGPDAVVAFQKDDPTESDDLYGVRYEQFLGEAYTVVELLKQNDEGGYDVKQTLFYDKAAETLLTGVTFRFTEGTYVNDSKVAYDILMGDELLLSVYTDGNGAADRKVLDGKQGVFEGTIDESRTYITVDGKGGMVIGDEQTVHPYTINDNGDLVVVIESDEGTTTYTFTLSYSPDTYEVDVAFEPKQAGSAYIGHTYSYANATYRLELAFGENTVDGTAYSKKTGKKSGDYCFTGATYEVDGNNVIISASTNYSGSGTLDLYYDGEEDTFTVVNVTGSLFNNNGLKIALGGAFSLKS